MLNYLVVFASEFLLYSLFVQLAAIIASLSRYPTTEQILHAIVVIKLVSSLSASGVGAETGR